MIFHNYHHMNVGSVHNVNKPNKCYDKCNTLLAQKDVITITNREFVHSFKKDLQKVIKSLHHKYMDNELE